MNISQAPLRVAQGIDRRCTLVLTGTTRKAQTSARHNMKRAGAPARKASQVHEVELALEPAFGTLRLQPHSAHSVRLA